MRGQVIACFLFAVLFSVILQFSFCYIPFFQPQALFIFLFLFFQPIFISFCQFSKLLCVLFITYFLFFIISLFCFLSQTSFPLFLHIFPFTSTFHPRLCHFYFLYSDAKRYFSVHFFLQTHR